MGADELTAKISCSDNGDLDLNPFPAAGAQTTSSSSPLSEWYTVNVTGVAGAPSAPLPLPMLSGNKRGLIDTLRVHIAPVRFEVDRIVLPAIRKKADRVWLITEKSSYQEDKGSPYAKSIARRLKESNIDCQQASADRIDLFDILRALRTIIMREKGNHILVNVSVGSKIQAIASMMICMMFKDMATIRPYYVVPERYNTVLLDGKKNQETEGMKDIFTLPEYKIEIPNEKLI